MAKGKPRKVWQMEDFGNIQSSVDRLARAAAAESAPAAATVLPAGLPTGISTTTAAPTPLTAPTAPLTPTPSTGVISPTAVVTEQATQAMNDPAAFTAKGNAYLGSDPTLVGKIQDLGGTIVSGGGSILSNLFNAEDEADLSIAGVNLSGVENVWDGFLKGVGWFYNGINQAGSYMNSAAPGGIDTYEWDEAAEISWGQSAIAANAALTNQFQSMLGETVGRVVGQVAGTVMNPLGSPGALVGEATDALYSKPEFDVTDEAQRKAAFEDSTVGRWVSGLTDVVPTVFADPLIFGGKALKVARIKWIDNPLKYEANRIARKTEIIEGVVKYESGQVDGHAPFMQWLIDMGKIDPITGKTMARGEIERRVEIVSSTNSPGIAQALHEAPDLATRALIARYAIGDIEAKTELLANHARTVSTLVDAKAARQGYDALVNPTRARQWISEADAEVVKAQSLLDETKAFVDVDMASRAQLEEAQRALGQAEDTASNLRSAREYDWTEGTDAATRKSLNDAVEDAVRNNEYAQRILSENIDSSLMHADTGFSSNTRLGRAVSGHRSRSARARYEFETTSRREMKGERPGYWTADYFGNLGPKRTIRYLRYWAGTVNPSYYLHFHGAGAADSGTEMNAIVDTLKYLSGKGRDIVENGVVVRTVGGVENKAKIVDEFTTAMNDPNAMHSFAERTFAFETNGTIVQDLVDYYGINRDFLDRVLARMQSGRATAEASIKEKRWFNSSDSVLAKSAHLESQLEEGMYVLPFDELEKRIIAAKKLADKGDTHYAQLFSGKEVAKDWISSGYSNFNDLWRPAVLMRFGYTQRNVTEGLFRSMAYNESLAPLAWAGKAGLNSIYNIRRAERVARRIPGIKTKLEATDIARDKFDTIVNEASDLARSKQELIAIRSRMEDVPAPLPERYDVPEWFDSVDGSYSSTADSRFQIIRQSHAVDVPATTAPRHAFVDVGGETHYGSFYISTWGRGKWEVGSTTGGQSVQFTTKAAAKDYARETQHALDQANLLPATTQEIDRFHILERITGDPKDGIKYANVGESKLTMLEAQQKVIDDVAEAQSGVVTDYKDIGRWQLDEIQTLYGPNREIIEPKIFVDDSNRAYSTIEEITAAIDRIEAEHAAKFAELKNLGPRPAAAALVGTKFQAWRDKQLDDMQKYVDDSDAFEASKRAEIAADNRALTSVEEANLYQLRRWKMDAEANIIALERDDVFALSQYQHQMSAPKRLGSGKQQMSGDFSGVTLYDAFGNPRYADIARANLSADNTVKATMSIRMQFSESLLLKKQMTTYAEIYPPNTVIDGVRVGTAEEYFTGMERWLRQFSQSRIGQDIVYDRDLRVTANWLLTDKEGIRIRKSIENVKGRDLGDTVPNVLNYLERLKAGMLSVTTGDASIIETMRTHPVTYRQLRTRLENNPNLVAVVGDTAEITGSHSLMEAWRSGTQKIFHLLGTLPEDTFVRAPFYAKRYKDAQEMLVAAARRDFVGETIPIERIQWIERQAHRVALKDTKKWLYTIDRRTNLGKYGEAVLPFISATQNSVTALARLTVRDPSLPGMMLALWRMPEKVGWEDDQGNLIIPLPKELIPDGVEDFFGLSGMSHATVGKSAMNVIFPESGFAFVPRPTPLVQAAASEIMKRGWFGQSVEAPNLFVSVMGAEAADQLWGTWKDYLFGEENGISPEFLSLDKLAPPVANKFIQVLQGDSSSQYAYQYALQARSEDMRWRTNARADYPKPEEIAARTNGQFALRMLGNLFAFTPPAYVPIVQPLIDMQRKFDKMYGLDGPMKFSELYGNELLILSNTDTTKNTGGSLSTTESVRNIRRNENLIRSISPDIADLNQLGIIINGNQVQAAYDASSYRWLSETKIPGRSENWRGLLSGPEAFAESQRTAGWVEYMKFMGVLDSMLHDKGLTNYRKKDAAQLVEYRKTFVSNMMNNPMYEGWRMDFQSTGSTKTLSAITVIQAALADEQFVKDHADDKTWQIASIYMDGRAKYAAAVQQTGHAITVADNEALADGWAAFQQNLINENEDWAAIANRYLINDNDPSEVNAPAPGLGEANG